MLWMTLALAGPLDDYGNQKHTDRPKVTHQTCEQAAFDRCKANCKGDATCVRTCRAEATETCKKRKRRQAAKTAEVVAKGASVGAGAVAVIAHNRLRKKNDRTGPPRESGPYTIDFFKTTFDTQLGGGALLGGVGAGTLNSQVRWAWLGAGGGVTAMAAEGSSLVEADVGPTFSIASPLLMFTAQPSLLYSRFQPAEPSTDPTFQPTVLGGGLRSYTTLYFRQLMLHFDPMLGLTNGQWNYHLRVGASYRFHPRVYVRINYDYRDIVDLTDLDISSASLQGVVGQLGVRFN